MRTVGGSTARSRWVLQVRDAFGRTRPGVIQVHRGYIYAHLDGVQARYSPREVSELRQVLADAQAEAFRQGGGGFQ